MHFLVGKFFSFVYLSESLRRHLIQVLIVRKSLLINNVEFRFFSLVSVSFPTPIEEPKNNLNCTYVGCMFVEKAGGMEILRPAIEKVAQTVPEEKWVPVTVNISPTSISVCSNNVRR